MHFEPNARQLRRILATMRERYVTTPTSMMLRLTGQEAWTDPITFPAGCTFNGLSPTTTSGLAPVVVNAATLTLTPALHGGRLVVLSGTTANAGVAITPPAATGTGDRYTIVFGSTITSNTTTLDAKAGNASDVFAGWIQTYKATTFTPYIANSTMNLMTFDGSTRGGIKGDIIRIIDVATNLWIVEGFTTQSGTIATPFTTH
jgi:hypothetical protein